MSEQARGLILQLLNRNPQKRLGSGPSDSEEIKKHDFFEGIDWNKVTEKKLPVPKPKIRKIDPNSSILMESFMAQEKEKPLNQKKMEE